MVTTLEVIIATTYTAVLIFYARSEAHLDALYISIHLPINHGRQLASRMVLAGSFTIMIGLSMWSGSHSWPSTLSLIPIGWAAWVITFRLALNDARGLALDYVSRSNRYDAAFMRIGEALDVNAGRLAYGAEGLVLVAGVLMLVL